MVKIFSNNKKILQKCMSYLNYLLFSTNANLSYAFYFIKCVKYERNTPLFIFSSVILMHFSIRHVKEHFYPAEMIIQAAVDIAMATVRKFDHESAPIEGITKRYH